MHEIPDHPKRQQRRHFRAQPVHQSPQDDLGFEETVAVLLRPCTPSAHPSSSLKCPKRGIALNKSDQSLQNEFGVGVWISHPRIDIHCYHPIKRDAGHSGKMSGNISPERNWHHQETKYLISTTQKSETSTFFLNQNARRYHAGMTNPGKQTTMKEHHHSLIKSKTWGKTRIVQNSRIHAT